MRPTTSTVLVMLAGAVMPATTGCAILLAPALKQPIREGVEPQNDGQYLLYKPSNYKRELAWPLVIVCHSDFPDSARSQIHNWTDKAESRGFIVAAPRLRSPGLSSLMSTGQHLDAQRKDAEHILATVQHVRAGHNISQDRVLIHGWSNGAVVALATGLKHPETFRAISVLQPKFVSAYMADVEHGVDPWQPVFVDYSGIDAITGKNARLCIDWLVEHDANLSEHSMGPARASFVDRTVVFYERTLRSHTYMLVKAEAADNHNPLAVRFRLVTSAKPAGLKWEFGDGDSSNVANPIHIFPSEGSYRVQVSLVTESGKKGTRTLELDVPSLDMKSTVN